MWQILPELLGLGGDIFKGLAGGGPQKRKAFTGAVAPQAMAERGMSMADQLMLALQNQDPLDTTMSQAVLPNDPGGRVAPSMGGPQRRPVSGGGGSSLVGPMPQSIPSDAGVNVGEGEGGGGDTGFYRGMTFPHSPALAAANRAAPPNSIEGRAGGANAASSNANSQQRRQGAIQLLRMLGSGQGGL